METSIDTWTSMWMFTAALFIIVKNWKQLRCLNKWLVEQTAELTHTTEHYCNKKEPATDRGDNLDGSQGNPEWKKVNLKGSHTEWFYYIISVKWQSREKRNGDGISGHQGLGCVCVRACVCVVINWPHKYLCDVRTVQYLDCGNGYMNIHTW